MSEPAVRSADGEAGPLLPDLLATAGRALAAAEGLLAVAKRRLLAAVAPRGAIEPALLETRQFAAHGYAWMATYVEALRRCCCGRKASRRSAGCASSTR